MMFSPREDFNFLPDLGVIHYLSSPVTSIEYACCLIRVYLFLESSMSFKYVTLHFLLLKDIFLTHIFRYIFSSMISLNF